MDKFVEYMHEKVEPSAKKISESDFIRTISSAFTLIMGVIIGGAFFALVSSLNIGPYQDFILSIGIKPFLSVVEKFTTGLMGVYISFAVGYSYMKIKELNTQAIEAGLCSIIGFLVLTPLTTIKDVQYMTFDYLGASGIFTGIIIGFIVGNIYKLCLVKNIKISMPDGTPPAVSKAFTAVIPSLLSIFIAVVINGLCITLLKSSATEFIYNLISTPFSQFTGSIFTFVVFSFFISLFWLFGIHGGQIITPFILMLYLQNGIANQTAFANGQTATNILTFSFFLITLIGGNGGTLGLSLDMLLFSKSKRYKTLGKLSIAPSLCGINEPLLFGMPIVMNAYMAIPFICVPIVNVLITYFVMKIGIVSVPQIATYVLGTPVFLDGFLVCGISGIFLQLVLAALSMLIYYPFFKVLDNSSIKEENTQLAE